MAVNQFYIISCQKKKIKKLEEEIVQLKEQVKLFQTAERPENDAAPPPEVA
jgi:hypothetical protein